LFPEASPSLLGFVCTLPQKPALPLSTLLSAEMEPDELDLLQKLLAFDPAERLSVHAALEHEFVADYHDGADEPFWPPFVDPLSNDASRHALVQNPSLYSPNIAIKGSSTGSLTIPDLLNMSGSVGTVETASSSACPPTLLPPREPLEHWNDMLQRAVMAVRSDNCAEVIISQRASLM